MNIFVIQLGQDVKKEKRKNMVKLPTVEEMLKAGLHFGHRASKWHPKMEPFIFTQRKGVHVINVLKTQDMLKNALEFISKIVKEDKNILFIGTRDSAKAYIREVALATNMPYISEKWLGGALTNFNIIKRSIKRYQDLLSQKQAGKLSKYTKKEQSDFDKEIEKLEKKVGGLVNLIKVPDVVFIWDIKKEKTALREAKRKKLPIIAVCDTNTNPDGIDYVIPANDDATKGLKMILDLIKNTILEVRNK